MSVDLQRVIDDLSNQVETLKGESLHNSLAIVQRDDEIQHLHQRISLIHNLLEQIVIAHDEEDHDGLKELIDQIRK